MRNLENDKDVIKQLLAVTPMDIPPMFSEISALHAIERAIAAEKKIKKVAKMLADFSNKHAPKGPSEIGLDLINIFLYIGEDAV